MKFRMKEWIVFITIVFIISLPAVILEVYYFYGVLDEVLINDVYSHLETTVQSRANHVESFLEEEANKVEILSTGTAFIEFLKSDENDENYDELLKEVNKRLRELSDASLVDKNGIILASTDSRKISIDYSKGVFFLGSKTESLTTIYYDKIEEEDLIGTVSPINDPETGEFLGAIGSNIELLKLNEITLDRVGLGETGEVYIINKEKKLLTPSRFMENSLFVQEVDTENSRKCLHMNTTEHIGHKQTEVFLDYRGEYVLGTHVYIPEMEWCLLAEIDEAEVLGIQRGQFLKTSLMVIISITFVIILIGFFVGRKLNKSYKEKKKISKKGKKKKTKLCLKCRYVFSLALIFALVYFFVVTSFLRGWQNALFYDDIPDLIFIVIALAMLYRGSRLKDESVKNIFVLGASLLLIAKLLEIPLQELQALGLVAPVFWYPISIMLFLGFLLLLFSYKEVVK